MAMARRKLRTLSEFRDSRRTIATRQAELERLGRRDAPEPSDDQFVTNR